MFFAPIAPLQFWAATATVSPYLMVLPSMYLADTATPTGTELYQYAIRTKARRAAGSYVMMDNGVSEFKEPLTREALLSIAYELRPTELILPDYLGDAGGTLMSVEDHLEWLKTQNTFGMVYMGVAQGLTLKEYTFCVKVLNDVGVKAVGLSKYFTRNTGEPRVALIEEVERLRRSRLVREDLEFHLLGLSPEEHLDTLADYARMYPWLRGIDTCYPILAAMMGKNITEDTEHVTSPEGFETADKYAYWPPSDERDTSGIITEVYNLLRINLRAFSRACEGRRR